MLLSRVNAKLPFIRRNVTSFSYVSMWISPNGYSWLWLFSYPDCMDCHLACCTHFLPPGKNLRGFLPANYSCWVRGERVVAVVNCYTFIHPQKAVSCLNPQRGKKRTNAVCFVLICVCLFINFREVIINELIKPVEQSQKMRDEIRRLLKWMWMSFCIAVDYG